MVMGIFFCFQESGSHIFCCDRVLDGFTDLCAGEIFPRCGDDLGVVVDLADQGYSGVQLILGDISGTGKNDRAGVFDLVLVELLKVLQVDLALAGIDDGNGTADLGAFHFLYRGHNIGELADSGGLDEDAVRRELCDYVFQGGAEITYQRAADAAGVHFRDLDSGFLKETAVDTDLTELILDQYQLLSVIAICDELFDQRGLTCA